MPAFDAQELGNALGWGLVFDTPNSFVWEIGHTSAGTSVRRTSSRKPCSAEVRSGPTRPSA